MLALNNDTQHPFTVIDQSIRKGGGLKDLGGYGTAAHRMDMKAGAVEFFSQLREVTVDQASGSVIFDPKDEGKRIFQYAYFRLQMAEVGHLEQQGHPNDPFVFFDIGPRFFPKIDEHLSESELFIKKEGQWNNISPGFSGYLMV